MGPYAIRRWPKRRYAAHGCISNGERSLIDVQPEWHVSSDGDKTHRYEMSLKQHYMSKSA